MVWKQGSGARRIAVFADPNCGYCKRFERDLQQVKDVTVYTFLIPILGGDSPEKATNIWCAKDSTRAWRDWMLDGKAPPRSMGNCETPMARNLALSRKHKVNGTPAIVFEDGTRVPGAMSAEQLEKQPRRQRRAGRHHEIGPGRGIRSRRRSGVRQIAASCRGTRGRRTRCSRRWPAP